jgi:hypothetical protein
MTIIQVNPCIEDEGGVSRCETPEAMFFGVYSCAPGEYEWVADFELREHAVLFARALAETHGYTVEDNTATHECHVVHLPSDDSEGGLT